MKRNFTFLLVLLGFYLQAQISVTKFSLPYVGATLKTYVNIAPNINYSESGANKTWDFSTLSKTNLNEVDLLEPNQGSINVANANFLIKSANGVIEQYYKTTDEFIEEIFIKTLDPVFNSFEILNSYAKNPVYRKANIYYGQSYASESKIQVPLAWADLPDTLVGGIGLSFDSIRFNTNFFRVDEITSYGTVILPDASWPALKEETSTMRSVTIDVFFFNTWIEAPTQLLEAFLGDFAGFLQPDTSYSINYYTDDAIEVLASLQLNDKNGSVIRVEYKAGSEITDTYKYSYNKVREVSSFPNPSFGNVTFKFENCKPGNYNIQVFDILGRKVHNTTYSLKTDNKPFNVDLSFLKKGTYLYSVIDPKGQKITTKKLVILNP